MSGAGFFGAGAEILGGVAGTQMSAQANERMQLHQLKWEKEKLGLEQQYNTQMANTAHQREIADLKAAGLNPILSAGGQGAPSPTVQGGSIGIVPDSSGQILSSSINAAVSALQLEREQNIKKQIADNQASLMEKQGTEASANAIRHLSESGALDAKAKESAANALLYEQKTENLRKESRILQNQIDNKELYKKQLQTEINKLEEDIKTAPTEREKNEAQKKLFEAEKDLTNTKKDLYKLGHIAAIVASAATGVGGVIGTVANTGKIMQMIKGGIKVTGFIK